MSPTILSDGPNWLYPISAAASGNTQNTNSINYTTVLTVVASIIGIYCGVIATQQILSTVRRRKLQKSQDELLRRFQIVVDTANAEKDAEAARQEVEEYSRKLDELRQQINDQLPIQARRDYLTERIDQLSKDIYRDYKEYQEAQKELEITASTGPLDDQIRNAIKIDIMPHRLIQERRNLTVLIVLVFLVVIDISPYKLNQFVYAYFNILGYPDEWYVSSVITAMIAGTATLAVLLVLAGWLFPQRSRFRSFFLQVSRLRVQLISISVITILLVVAYFSREGALNDDLGLGQSNVAYLRTVAGLSLNIVVIAIAMSIAGIWYRYQNLFFTIRNRARQAAVPRQKTTTSPTETD
jgi:hypothetical protein